MLHELFFAMCGLESSFWQLEDVSTTDESEESIKHNLFDENKFSKKKHFHLDVQKLEGKASCFIPCEIELIEEILQISELYKRILVFYEKVQSNCTLDSLPTEGSNLRPGHYLTALVSAIYDETAGYRLKVAQLESDYLEAPMLTLSSIRVEVKPFYHVFEELCNILSEVEEKKLHGCQILNLVKKRTDSLVGDVGDTFERIRNKIQKVLIEQLTFWVLFGELMDPYEESFIKVQNESSSCETQSSQRESGNSSKEERNRSSVNVNLVVDQLPEFIPLTTAEKILFIGENILCFGNNADSSDKVGLVSLNDEKSLMDKFSNALESEASPQLFVDLVEEQRSLVSNRLYSLLIASGLEKSLGVLFDLFLLGRGELFRAFYALVSNARLNSFNINTLFQRSGRLIGLEESIVERIRVSYQPKVPPSHLDVWRTLHIDLDIDWPLQKFFTPTIMEKYNGILKFLLSLRQTQIRLQDLWVIQREAKGKMINKLLVSCLTLRHHMNLLIYNILYYIQVDVLQAQFDELIKKMRSLNDYQAINYQHEAFLTLISAQCFLSHPHIAGFITLIIDIVNSFCDLLCGTSFEGLESKVEKLTKEFEGASAKFLWALNTLCQTRNGRYTSQLVLRINYNNFYSKGVNSSSLFTADL